VFRKLQRLKGEEVLQNKSIRRTREAVPQPCITIAAASSVT